MILVIAKKLFPSLIEIINSKSLDYEVMHCSSYDGAIRTIEKNLSVNLIILDIDVLKDQSDSVQKIFLTSQIPIILSTSDTNRELDEDWQNKSYGCISEYIDYFSLKNLIKTTLRLFENDYKLKQAKKLIRKKEEKYRNLFQGHHAAMLLIDPETGEILSANNAATDFYGWSQDELKNINIKDINTLDKEELYYKINCVNPKNHFIFKHRIADGSIKDVEVHTGRANVEGKTTLFSIIHDITDRKQAEKKNYSLAYYDTLTGLPNRKLFFKNLSNTLFENKKDNFKTAVIIIDLDSFNDINTLYGHEVGDTLLKKITERMKKIVSTNKSLYRLGGDEFAVICKEYSDNQNCQSVCKKIDNTLSVPFRIDGKEIFISASKGIAVYPDSSLNMYALFKNSDIALQKAKQQKKGKCLAFSENMSEEIKHKKRIEIELKKALEEDKLQLYFQPKIDIIKNKIIGTEALLRWKLDKIGYISPAEFIPIAEESGLILDIDRWVFSKACQQIKQWMKMGLRDQKISVNISGHHFKQGNLVKTVSDILKTVKIPSKSIEIEITENIFLENIEQSIKTLNILRGKGIDISLDDFGTGYSSLSYLKNLPLDRIKIDQSFIRNISNSKQDKAIVKTIVTIANLLDLKVIAEGVETEEELKIVKESGCTEVQGFYFAKPMPAKDYINFIKTFG